MSNGGLTWQNRIEIRYQDDRITFEIASIFEVHDRNVRYVLGNAHLFYVPSNAFDISVEENVKSRGESYVAQVGVYLLNDAIGHPNLYRDDNDTFRVFPETKSFQDIELFNLVLHYSILWTRPLQEEFFAEPHVRFFLGEYLKSLNCGERETIGGCEILIYPPTGCEWGESASDEIAKGLKKLRSMEVIGCTGVHVDRKSIQISLRPNQASLGASHVEMPLRLSVSQDAVTVQQYSDKIENGIANTSGEEVIVFVCDLRGSTGQTREGKPSPNVLRYHGYWRRDVAEPFRLLKIVGDLVLAVCEPQAFLQEGLREILSAYEKSLQLGLPIRGGFHAGIAKAIGSRADTMSGSAIGEDFLGDAINHGSKIGDFKENDNGLIASGAFIDWITKAGKGDPAATYWRDMTIGTTKVGLFRIDPSRLLKSVQQPLPGGSPVKFPDKLVDRAKAIRSRLIVGLDPDIYRFPFFLKEMWMKRPTAETLQDIIFQFNRIIIEATNEFAVAFKPQIAFYEQFGDAGIHALRMTIRHLREREQIILLDAKRNDIEHTAKAYADAWLAQSRPFTETPNDWRVDAITLNAYLGIEGVTPFLQADSAAGVFLLAKTSNPSSADLQDLKLDKGSTVYEEMARLAEGWGKSDGLGKNGYSRVGLVVGATHPEACERIRAVAPSALFLMPGVGAQGAPLKSIKIASGKDGFGAYASSSRTVLYGFAPDNAKASDWKEVVRESAANEAKKLRDGINEELAS